jgi:hypothetical protein
VQHFPELLGTSVQGLKTLFQLGLLVSSGYNTLIELRSFIRYFLCDLHDFGSFSLSQALDVPFGGIVESLADVAKGNVLIHALLAGCKVRIMVLL